jgi:hypothetical protein
MIPLPAPIRNAIGRFLKDISTTADGESFDVIRVTVILAGLAFVFCAIWDCVVNRHFNGLEVGGGFGTMAGGAGFGIGQKVKDEPPVSN